MLDAFGVRTLPEVGERDGQVRERDGLQPAVAELEARLTSALDDFIHARSLLEGLDLDGLAIEKAEIERRLADLAKSVTCLHIEDSLLAHGSLRRPRCFDRLSMVFLSLLSEAIFAPSSTPTTVRFMVPSSIEPEW
nr:hypothetical protein [Mesorhizobium atlanticum]